MSAPLVLNAATTIRLGQRARVYIQVVDCDGQPADATTLSLQVIRGGCPIFEEDYFQPYMAPKVHRIVKTPGKSGSYYIDWGDMDYPAVVVGVGAVFPTGFLGGEKLSVIVDGLSYEVTFQAGDQTLAAVVARINAVVGVAIGQPFADAFAGQLRLTTAVKGKVAYIQIVGSIPVLAALGLTAGFTYGTEVGNETDCTSKLIFAWKFSDSTQVVEEILQTVYVLPVSFLGMLQRLRLLIDKSLKLVNNADGCFLGYTDANLVQFLLGGMENINAYQPSIFFSPDNFPYDGFGEVLVEAALIVGVMSQTLFAIDTDITSYNDQGQSFVINHQQPLAAFLNSMTARLDKNIPLFKLHFVRSGSVLTQMGPSYRLNMLLQAAPSGSLFRGVFFRA